MYYNFVNCKSVELKEKKTNPSNWQESIISNTLQSTFFLLENNVTYSPFF